MTEVLLRVLVVAFIAATVVAVAVIVRKMMRGPGLAALLAPKSPKRVDVVEQTVIDAKRRLVLIRRDNVEHLILTGGPVDIIVENGIGASSPGADSKPTTQPRQHPPHPLGLAAE